MKLFSGKVSIIAAEVTKVLIDSKSIETESPSEVENDVEAVLNEYIRTDRELTDMAKDLCEKRGISSSSFYKIKRQLAKKRDFIIGDEAMDYIMEQMILTFMNSQFVDEIFAEDHELKKQIRTVLRIHTEIEDEISKEAREKIKNLEEGTRDWEIEFSRAMANVKRRRGLV